MPPFTPRPLTAADVLYEDNHCLAVMKPARLLTAGDATGDVSLLELAKDYIRDRYQKPGAVFLGLVHRLDRPVSGVVLFARTSKAAARLSEEFRERRVAKAYQALVAGKGAPPAGELTDWLLKDAAENQSSVVPANTPGARPCRLQSKLLRKGPQAALLELHPETGRSHQIRVQLASRGWPILGDVKYGSQRRLGGVIALHAWQLTFTHPTRREPVTVTAPLPPEWEEWLR